MHRNRQKGLTLVELLVAALLVAMAALTAVSSIRMAASLPRNKRVTEMAVYVSVAALERIKAIEYSNMTDVTPLPPSATASKWYYDKFGTPVGSAATDGYTVEYGIQLEDTNGDGVYDSLDMRRIVVEVYDNGLASLYERIDVKMANGGI